MMDELISRYEEIMDKNDPDKQVELFVDEWGIWTDPIPGSIPGHLFQQNTMRDALLASTTIDIFHRHTERVKMANIAQVVNVLQSMILTSGDTMLLTPTYHVFNMYKGHMEGTLIPIEYEDPGYMYNGDAIPAIHNTISKSSEGSFTLTFSNLDPNNENELIIPMGEQGAGKVINGQLLTAQNFNDYNSFREPYRIKPIKFTDYTYDNGILKIIIPPISVVLFEME